MTTFISLLRGINVSGQKLIKMDALKTMYRQLDFQNAETYLQSGNVIFRDDHSDPTILAATISSKIQEQFGFEVQVIVFSVDDLKAIIEANPFKDDLLMDQQFLHVTFLASDPKEIDFEKIAAKKSPGEEIVRIKKAVYLYCPHGYGRTKLTNNFLETKLRVGATTRNWKTVNELLKIAKEMEIPLMVKLYFWVKINSPQNSRNYENEIFGSTGNRFSDVAGFEGSGRQANRTFGKT